MNVYINPNWTFRELVRNVKSLKQQYVFCLDFFSFDYTYEELKYKNSIIRETKQKIYALNMEEWRKDKVWEYMNGYEFYSTLRYLVERLDNK